MALFNYATREINAKIVYYGIGLSGKTTNIQQVYQRLSTQGKGKLVTIPTYGDRTIFLDFFPVDVGEINGFKLRFHLYTVPGQVFYNSTRKLVLKGADGVVFVADSQRSALDSNIQSIKNLKQNLAEEGIDLDQFPFVIQYNKRDLPNIMGLEELNEQLNPNGVPVFEAAAVSGEGVIETLKAIGKVVVKNLRRSLSKREGNRSDEVSPVRPSGKEISEATVSAESRGSKTVGGIENKAIEEKISAPMKPSVSLSVDIKEDIPFSKGSKEEVSSISQKEETTQPQRIILNLVLEIELEESQGKWKPKKVRVKNLNEGESSMNPSTPSSSGEPKISPSIKSESLK